MAFCNGWMLLPQGDSEGGDEEAGEAGEDVVQLLNKLAAGRRGAGWVHGGKG